MADDDLTPPPDEALPEQSRARIRAELLRAAQDGRAAGRRPWLASLVAAAAVLAVVGVGAWVVRVGGDESGGPAAAPTSSATPGADWSMSWPDSPTSDPSAPSTSAASAGSSCAEPLAEVLPGAELATTFPAGDGGGETTMWVAGDRFALCDVRAGTTTVQHPVSMARSHGVAPYRVSSIYPPTPDGYRTIRVAGGLVPEGLAAFDVSYTFPDGHTERATTTTDDQGRTWWRMVYAYDDGGGNELDEPPIEVTVRYSGVQRTYSLAWGVDTCAQANHGC